MVIRARALLKGGGPGESAEIVDNGAIVIKDGRILWLGGWRDCPVVGGEEVRDLGEVVLIPGLINAHCHLDYTSMAGKIPPPRAFPDWVMTILSYKAHWSFSEYAESWLNGARMLVEHGVTTVADIESVPELPPEMWKSTSLRVISFFEMTCVKSGRSAEEILVDAIHWMESLPKIGGKEAAISPHALYSTTPELMRKAALMGRDRSLLVSTHLAESEAEFEMFTQARGPFYDWLKGQRQMEDCGKKSPVQLAAEYGLLNERFLAVHANYLASGDSELLGGAGSSVVHCPRSHKYFGHSPFPYRDLKEAGVRICLGTDSLASTRKNGLQIPELNLWDEMRLFAGRFPSVAPWEIFAMATALPAAALGKSSEVGTLHPGKLADCVAMTYSGDISERQLYEEILFAGEVREVFIGGELVKSV